MQVPEQSTHRDQKDPRCSEKTHTRRSEKAPENGKEESWSGILERKKGVMKEKPKKHPRGYEAVE